MFDKNDNLKLVDFGFADTYSKGELKNPYYGTLSYSSPQIVSKEPHDP